ncbi:MAG: YciI family protein [Asticcacaulis sp.]
MFIIFLRFAAHKDKAPAFMEAHKLWLKQGFAEGVFLMSGSLKPAGGGVILAHALSLEEAEVRVQADPFVREGIVSAEIIEVSPSMALPPFDSLSIPTPPTP